MLLKTQVYIMVNIRNTHYMRNTAMLQYFSLDIETTGLNPETCQILEVAIVFDDFANPKPVNELPYLQFYVNHEQIQGEPYALAMNAEIIKRLVAKNKKDKFVHSDHIFRQIISWITRLDGVRPGKVTLAGKNLAGFDLRFLEKVNGWDKQCFHHRAIDPAMFYLESEDHEPPSLKVCMERAGLGDVTKAHDALEDARDVIRLIRSHYNYQVA